MITNGRIRETFLAEAGRLSDTLLERGLIIATPSCHDDRVAEIFEDVEIIKTSALVGCDGDDDLTILAGYCCHFEAFLEVARGKGNALSKGERELITDALTALCTDIETLRSGATLTPHATILLRFDEVIHPVITCTETRDTFMVMALDNIMVTTHVDRFSKTIWRYIDKGGCKGRELVINLQGIYLISSTAMGAILGMTEYFTVVTILSPPRMIERTLRRFDFTRRGVILE